MIRGFTYILISIFVLFGQYGFATNTNDRLGDAYDRSHNGAQNPYSSDVEADDLFNTNVSITVGGGSDTLGLNDSVIVRLARVLMRIAIVLAIPMILYSAIRIALAFGNESKFQEALKHIGWVLGGVVLVLASVAIVLLITSLARNSVGLFSAGA